SSVSDRTLDSPKPISINETDLFRVSRRTSATTVLAHHGRPSELPSCDANHRRRRYANISKRPVRVPFTVKKVAFQTCGRAVEMPVNPVNAGAWPDGTARLAPSARSAVNVPPTHRTFTDWGLLLT